MKTKLAVSIGDPAGIGPEVTLKALLHPDLKDSVAFTIIGDAELFRKTAGDIMKVTLPDNLTFVKYSDTIKCPSDGHMFIDLENASDIKPAVITKQNGKAAFECVELGARLAMEGKVDGLVTAPIHKKSIELAGHDFQGHTDYLKHLTHAQTCSMMLCCPEIRVVLATVHIALKDVPVKLTTDKVARAIRHAHKAGKDFGFGAPRIGVCGLNPHAGEEGRFGDEEGRIILPAIEECRKEGIDCSNPLPPDTAFFSARQGNFDMMVAMYHDQGLIPMKLVGFEEGVNVTVGLPIVRTSPDHGTAFDIAWQNKANDESMVCAVKTAVALCKGRKS